MLLKDLLRDVEYEQAYVPAGTDVRALKWDSRAVCPGDLFVAVPGVSVDGHRFIVDAVARGASGVVGQPGRVPENLHRLVARVEAPNPRKALAELASAWYDYPGRKLAIVGVTGTDGKTTTVSLIASILRAAGRHPGFVSTVNAEIGALRVETGLHTTTPDAPDLQRYLAEMVAAGSDYAVLETTSHGLAQERAAAVDFDVAVVTNITHEHLDFHQTFEEYRAAKARLFGYLSTTRRKPGVPKAAVVNYDDPARDLLLGYPADLKLTYGIGDGATVTAHDVVFGPEGATFEARYAALRFPVRTCLLGDYNVSNTLAAIAAALSQSVPVEAIVRGLEGFAGVRGRMEMVDLGQDFSAIVDFAHTPNSLEQVLALAQQIAKGRVIVVFGSAGLRDVGKRALMGAVAARLADFTVITAEDPRTESLEDIMAQIAGGAREAGGLEGRDFIRVADRGEAIQAAVDLAERGDMLIVAGKGHEQSMCFGATEVPWSDHDTLVAALRKRLGLV